MPALVPIDDSWGAVLIAVFMGVFLYGVLTMQTFLYSLRYPKDGRGLKTTVGVVWVLDTLQTIFVCHMMYTYLITDFGDYTAIQGNTWSFNMHVLVTTLIASISQVYFTHRCWRFDKSTMNTVLCGVIMAVATIQFCFGATCCALTFTLCTYKAFLNYTWAVDTWLGSAAACDILVSVALIRSLWLSQTSIARTKSLIEKLIKWTVTTGMLTSIFAICDIAFFTGSTSTLIHLFFNVMLAKLYGNTLLATLNQRRPTNDDEVEPMPNGISLPHLGRTHVGSAHGGVLNIQSGVGVHVTTHTINDVDQDSLEDQMYKRPAVLVNGRSDSDVKMPWVDERSHRV